MAKGTKVVIRIDPSKTPESLSANKDDWDACVHRQSGLMTILRIRCESTGNFFNFQEYIIKSIKIRIRTSQWAAGLPSIRTF